MSAAEQLAIGVGNPWRRDDGVGPYIAARLAALGLSEVRVMQASGEGAALIEAMGGAQRVWLFDAVSSGAAPGTVHRIDAGAQPVPRGFFNYSTHAFSVAEAIELARALGQLPARCLLFGIEGADFSSGRGLSAPVAESAEAVVEEAGALLADAEVPCTKPA